MGVTADHRTVVNEYYTRTMATQVADVPADTNTEGFDLHTAAEAMLDWSTLTRFFIAEYHLVLIFRFFTGFRVQPRLGVVVGTLEHCMVDIIHFFIVLLPTFMAFAVSGFFIFGHRLEQFSTLNKAICICFKLIMEGEYDWQALSAQNYWTALIWTWSFMLLLVLLMLNMVLAILMDIYTDMRRGAGQSETVWQTFANIYMYVRNYRSWISNEELMEGVAFMPRVVMRDEVQSLFPGMCEAQLLLLTNACDQESKQAGGMDVKDSTKMTMATKLCIDKVEKSLRELLDSLVDQEENKAEQPFTPAASNRLWYHELSERMAVQNHCLLATQWQMQQLQWQWQTLEAMGSRDEITAALAAAAEIGPAASAAETEQAEVIL